MLFVESRPARRPEQANVRETRLTGRLDRSLYLPATERTMAIILIFEVPGMTQADYEQSVARLTGGPALKSPADWPVPGLISHTAAPTPDGWLIADVWESEEAAERFGEVIRPIMQELGAPDVQPKIYPVFNVVAAQPDQA
jgi:hypothetical protein